MCASVPQMPTAETAPALRTAKSPDAARPHFQPPDIVKHAGLHRRANTEVALAFVTCVARDLRLGMRSISIDIACVQPSRVAQDGKSFHRFADASFERR